MKCSGKCQTKLSSVLGGKCNDACVLEKDHAGRCKCRLMSRIDAAVTPLPATEKVDFDIEQRARWREATQKRRAKKVEKKKAAGT